MKIGKYYFSILDIIASSMLIIAIILTIVSIFIGGLAECILSPIAAVLYTISALRIVWVIDQAISEIRDKR